MYRYQILIEYVGTNFIGWQIQSKGLSVQKLIEIKLYKLLKEKINLVGSGRTDSGVHAIEQSAHFDYKKKIEKLEGKIFWNNSAESIIGKINGLYPSPGGWFLYNGERYKILKAEISNGVGKAGTVLDNYLEICCSEKSIKILEIQRQGKRPQNINEFMLGSQIKKGSNLNNV